MNSRRAREVYSSVDQTKKVKTKKKVFSTNIATNSGRRLKILAIFYELLSTPVAPSLLISSGHSPRLRGGAQFSFGGGTSSHFEGARPRNAPRGPRPALFCPEYSTGCQRCGPGSTLGIPGLADKRSTDSLVFFSTVCDICLQSSVYSYFFGQ